MNRLPIGFAEPVAIKLIRTKPARLLLVHQRSRPNRFFFIQNARCSAAPNLLHGSPASSPSGGLPHHRRTPSGSHAFSMDGRLGQTIEDPSGELLLHQQASPPPAFFLGGLFVSGKILHRRTSSPLPPPANTQSFFTGKILTKIPSRRAPSVPPSPPSAISTGVVFTGNHPSSPSPPTGESMGGVRRHSQFFITGLGEGMVWFHRKKKRRRREEEGPLEF